MAAPDSPIYSRSETSGALRQGEILTGLLQARLALETVGTQDPTVSYERHLYAIVLSQDCDLDLDWKARDPQTATDPNAVHRQLPSVLFAQMNTADELRGRIRQSDIWKRLHQNKDERYQFLEVVPPTADALGEGLPELGIDFKRYFTVPTDEVYRRLEGEAHRRCRLLSPYLQHLSTRFCFYQFRVALPREHKSM